MKTCLEFSFNNINSYDMGVYNVFDKGEEAKEIISPARSIVVSKPLLRDSDIIEKIENEKLSFTLNLIPINKSFTPEFINSLYKWFDVDDYTKLSFADDPEFYYRVIPFTEQSEVTLFANKKGSFPVSFICDSGHGYVDVFKTLEIEGGERLSFVIPNKNGIRINGNYNVPVFLSCNFDGTGADSFTIQIGNSSDQFILSPIPSGVRQIDIDNESGIVICDNGANGYNYISGIDNLVIQGNKDNTITFTNNSTKPASVYFGASIPLMGYQETGFNVHC